MPRRARPSNRPRPSSNVLQSTTSRFPVSSLHPSTSRRNLHRANQTRPKAVDFLSDTESGSGEDEDDLADGRRVSSDDGGNESIDVIGGGAQADSDDDDDDDGQDGESGHSEEEDDADADAPRISLWVDDETLGEGPAEEDSEGTDEDGGDVQVRSLKNNLSTLPLGALRKAQRSLAQAQALSESDSSVSESEASDDDDRENPPNSFVIDKAKDTKPKELPKRPHKHAPTEISSKRPVTRRRTVVEDSTPKPRDPRFTHASGAFSPDKFRTQYTFLSDLHTGELAALREDYKRARRLLANSPRELRPAREEEVARLERAVKRAESTVHRDAREKVEAEALGKAKQAEAERRKQGKGAWFMKRSERKDLLNKARFDAIAASGGKQAVKKAIEKKQKKISQKEKKSRPFARGSTFSQGADSGGDASGKVAHASSKQDGRKRRAGPGDSTNKGAKRRKVA